MSLYDTLTKNISNNKLSREEKKLLETISWLSEKETYAIRDIILEYIAEEKGISRVIGGDGAQYEDDQDIPYFGQQLKDGTEFCVEKLPLRLSRILVKFLNIVNNNKV